MKDFLKCTNIYTSPSGFTEVECKLGLWSVSAQENHTAVNEAMHYFEQYKADGEYSSIIGGENVIEKLAKKLHTNRGRL